MYGTWRNGHFGAHALCEWHPCLLLAKEELHAARHRKSLARRCLQHRIGEKELDLSVKLAMKNCDKAPMKYFLATEQGLKLFGDISGHFFFGYFVLDFKTFRGNFVLRRCRPKNRAHYHGRFSSPWSLGKNQGQTRDKKLNAHLFLHKVFGEPYGRLRRHS